jgi:hypothetical protein
LIDDQARANLSAGTRSAATGFFALHGHIFWAADCQIR